MRAAAAAGVRCGKLRATAARAGTDRSAAECEGRAGVSSAEAIAGAMTPPTPSITASAPTRPTYRAGRPKSVTTAPSFMRTNCQVYHRKLLIRGNVLGQLATAAVPW